MAPKSKLKLALAAEKGFDVKKMKEKKKTKAALKAKSARGLNGGAAAAGKAAGDDNDDDWEGVDEEEEEDEADGGALVDDDEDEDEEADGIDLAALDESDDSDSSVEMEEKIVRTPKPKAQKVASNPRQKKSSKNDDVEEDEDEDEEEEDEEDIPMSDLEDLADEDREDLIPHTRLTINNTAALLAAVKRISIPTGSSVPFTTHQSIVSVEPTADSIEDIQDDLKREVALYGQSLDAAKRARALLKAEGVPFSRPTDYFAEMVKDDGHMEKVKAKLIEDASNKKAASEARKLRDLKKFGKQVQVAKLQERQKAKRETLEKISTLKRKRAQSSNDLGAHEADLFDVGVESELGKHANRRGGDRGGRDGDRTANAKRQKKNEKFGFGGKKRHAKSGDAMSSADMSGFSARRMKTGTKASIPKTSRLGKTRRKAGAGKR